ncbi:hypothetical protein [Haloarchaeobius sp. DFWS5]|uniref:hypothetical protein n=1 Tax=Haloarchaeobius sp. DFWS5 TaxID=3446114 RepID=UPI003EBBC17A
MHRRRLLARSAVALPAVLAGCLGAEDGPSSGRTDSLADTDGNDAPYLASIASLDVYRRTTTIEQGNHVDVRATDDEQYVVVDFDVYPPSMAPPADQELGISDPDDIEVVVTLDGDEYPDWFPTDFGEQYGRGVAVPIPTGVSPSSCDARSQQSRRPGRSGSGRTRHDREKRHGRGRVRSACWRIGQLRGDHHLVQRRPGRIDRRLWMDRCQLQRDSHVLN